MAYTPEIKNKRTHELFFLFAHIIYLGESLEI